MDPDRQADIAALDSTLTTVERVVDVDGLRSRIEKLEHEASDPKLWEDQTRAQQVTSELSHAQGELRRVEELRRRLDDLPVLYELAEEEGGADTLAEADAELKALRADIEAMEVRTLLSGEYDEREALVTIRSGRRGRRRGLGRDADAYVHPLGRTAQLPGRGVRHVVCRRGRDKERDLRHPRALRLRDLVGGTRHPPAGSAQPVR
ncbi:peptide chain release factor 2 [Mycobacterium xenopi 3993]|nr:peptide chain release factor 2 [Mycobacterium xenopi 3993]